jgi:hypothetical protein
MNSRQLKDILKQIEALKTPDASVDFQAGVDAAYAVVDAIVQEALDRERIQKLEAELAELKAKYEIDSQPAPKRRGRRPKAAAPPEPEFEVVAGA